MNDFYFKPCQEEINEDYNLNWLDNYMNALIESEFKYRIAQDWDSSKSVLMACNIIGALIEGGVIKGGKTKIADCIHKNSKYAPIKRKKNKTLADYMGRSKDYEDLYVWTQEYIEEH